MMYASADFATRPMYVSCSPAGPGAGANSGCDTTHQPAQVPADVSPWLAAVAARYGAESDQYRAAMAYVPAPAAAVVLATAAAPAAAAAPAVAIESAPAAAPAADADVVTLPAPAPAADADVASALAAICQAAAFRRAAARRDKALSRYLEASPGRRWAMSDIHSRHVRRVNRMIEAMTPAAWSVLLAAEALPHVTIDDIRPYTRSKGVA